MDMRRVCGSLVLLLALLVAASAVRAEAQQPAPDPETVFRGFIDAQNRGDVDAALAFFTDDAVASGTPVCPPPGYCAGRQGVRRRIEAAVANHIRVDVTNVEVADGTLLARTLMRADSITAAGVIRIVVYERLAFEGSKIRREVRELDLTDEFTAAYLARQQEPAAAADAPIRSPATGDAGLAGGLR